MNWSPAVRRHLMNTKLVWTGAGHPQVSSVQKHFSCDTSGAVSNFLFFHHKTGFQVFFSLTLWTECFLEWGYNVGGGEHQNNVHSREYCFASRKYVIGFKNWSRKTWLHSLQFANTQKSVRLLLNFSFFFPSVSHCWVKMLYPTNWTQQDQTWKTNCQ